MTSAKRIFIDARRKPWAGVFARGRRLIRVALSAFCSCLKFAPFLIPFKTLANAQGIKMRLSARCASSNMLKEQKISLIWLIGRCT